MFSGWGEEALTVAAQLYGELSDEETWGPRCQPEHVLFVHVVQDMLKFCEEVGDEQGLLVNTIIYTLQFYG